jgi:uncharacterized protein
MEYLKQIFEQIEKTHNIKLLYACETGSRAWGFPSPDSDYDVRFLYKHERDWYLALNTQKDSIEFMDGDLDITGWDLRKCLKLLKKSNVPLIERFQSPIEYYAEEGFKDEFKRLINSYYSPIASFYHHYSLANKFWEALKEKKEIKLKSYFYLLRSLLSCNWILKDDNVLPMHIEGLMYYVDENKRQEIRELIQLKATLGEGYLHLATAEMTQYVVQLFKQAEEGQKALKTNEQNYLLLNEFFKKTVYGNNRY